MNLAANHVQTQTPQFFELGIYTINALDEIISLSNPTIRIRRLIDVTHCNMPTHIFVETTVVGVSEAKSNYDYNYKTEFQIWKENNEFERECFSIS